MEISYMILIVGGTFQGKKAFAEKLLNEKREDFTDGTSCAFSDIYHAKVLFHFHEYIRRMLEQEMCKECGKVFAVPATNSDTAGFRWMCLTGTTGRQPGVSARRLLLRQMQCIV